MGVNVNDVVLFDVVLLPAVLIDHVDIVLDVLVAHVDCGLQRYLVDVVHDAMSRH